MPNDLSNNASIWNTSCTGCTDPLALNYDSTSTIDDGSCNYSPVLENIFFSEYAEGSGGGTGRYFEIYNPTSNTIDLAKEEYQHEVSLRKEPIQVMDNWDIPESITYSSDVKKMLALKHLKPIQNL